MWAMIKKLFAAIVYTTYRILAPLVRFETVAVLAYHSISDAKDDTSIPAQRFEAQLAYLKKHNHTFVSLEAVLAWLQTGKQLPENAVALSFDDGYADFETTVLPILKKYNAPATVFVMEDLDASRPRLGNGIPLLDTAALERLKQESLIEIGSHGRTHARLTHLKGDPLREEMHRPLGMRYFAYAGGAYTHEAMEVAQELGYDAAFAIKPGLVTKKSDLYLLQRNVITHGMTAHDVEFRTSHAIEWYARMARWFK